MRSETLVPDKNRTGKPFPQHRGVLALTYLLCALECVSTGMHVSVVSLDIRPAGISSSVLSSRPAGITPAGIGQLFEKSGICGYQDSVLRTMIQEY